MWPWQRTSKRRTRCACLGGDVGACARELKLEVMVVSSIQVERIRAAAAATAAAATAAAAAAAAVKMRRRKLS